MTPFVGTYTPGKVWAGHKVNFDFLATGGRLIVAYYGEDRELILASTRLGENRFSHCRLPVRTGWDSHNYIALAADREGVLHLAADMHASPLVYFRSEHPYDIGSMRRIDRMTGAEETRCTYPIFMTGNNGELLFHYRSGSSGDGSEIYNVYSSGQKSWSRLFDAKLTDGEGKRNAYFTGPVKGPDGFFHLIWMWRDTPDCETDHDLSYMRSRDLVHWEKADGTAVALPARYDSPGLIFDRTASRFSGLINMNNAIGFDRSGRVVATYHKYDENGFSQIYNARLDREKWTIRQADNWHSRWNFSGGGSIPCEIQAGAVRVEADGTLTQKFHHFREGDGKWILDDELNVMGTKPCSFSELPEEAATVRGTFPGLRVRLLEKFGEDGTRYMMRWETLDAYRDRERPLPWPEASPLELFEEKSSVPVPRLSFPAEEAAGPFAEGLAVRFGEAELGEG